MQVLSHACACAPDATVAVAAPLQQFLCFDFFSCKQRISLSSIAHVCITAQSAATDGFIAAMRPFVGRVCCAVLPLC
jgi:hypothetical protein